MRPETRPTTESSGQAMRLSPGESTPVKLPRRSTIPTEAVSTHSMQKQEKGMIALICGRGGAVVAWFGVRRG